MEELDAKVDKTNHDLLDLESKKKELEEEKLANQKEIQKLEKEKIRILEKTDKMKSVQKLIYIFVSLRNDLKNVELLNVKISEYKKQQDKIQNKIEIQNQLYSEAVTEKEKYIEQRKELYSKKETEKVESNGLVLQIKALSNIYQIAEPFKDNKIMGEIRKIVEESLNQYMNSKQKTVLQEQEEME